MDGQNNFYPQELPPVVPVSLYETPQVSQQVADIQRTVEVERYEPYSIAAAIHSMFEEAEQGFDETRYWASTAQEQEYPSDTEAFRMYMKEVHRELKQSGAVQELRLAADGGHEITKGMVEAVFRAYQEIVSRAAEKLRRTLSPEQLNQLKQAGRNNLDWSYRGLLMERLTQDESAPARYALEDFFLILNPKARKVQYMERQEVLKSLRYTMSLGNKEQLQHDVRLARQFAREDMGGEKISDEDLQSLETQPN